HTMRLFFPYTTLFRSYALILFTVAAAKDYFGESGLYVISIISGLTTVDAITLSLSHSLNSGELEVRLAWKLILVDSLSNLAFKGDRKSTRLNSSHVKI